MAIADAAADYLHGVDLLQSGNPVGAIQYFRNALECEERNPYYLSFLGLAIARAHKKWAAAAALCEAALRFGPGEPQLYLNLAEVYAAGRRRKDARELLDSALKRFGPTASVAGGTPKPRKPRGQVLPFVASPLSWLSK